MRVSKLHGNVMTVGCKFKFEYLLKTIRILSQALTMFQSPTRLLYTGVVRSAIFVLFGVMDAMVTHRLACRDGFNNLWPKSAK